MFLPWLTKNHLYKKSSTKKLKIFIGFLVAECEGRLTPFNHETPKRRKKINFLARLGYSRCPTGKRTAAASAITTVKIIVFVPEEIPSNTGIL